MVRFDDLVMGVARCQSTAFETQIMRQGELQIGRRFGLHRRCPPTRTLDRVFWLEETRTVGQDWVCAITIAPARSTVTVSEWPDGRPPSTIGAARCRGRR